MYLLCREDVAEQVAVQQYVNGLDVFELADGGPYLGAHAAFVTAVARTDITAREIDRNLTGGRVERYVCHAQIREVNRIVQSPEPLQFEEQALEGGPHIGFDIPGTAQTCVGGDQAIAASYWTPSIELEVIDIDGFIS